MAFDAKGPLAQLATLVTGLTSMQGAAVKGVPKSLAYGVNAYITLGGQELKDIAGGLRGRWMRYLITFAYRVESAPDDAEDTIADLLDELEAALYADRTMNSTVESLEADFSGADNPSYAAIAGQEFRRYPVVVTVKQRRNYP
jgi:hypothetical protein